MSSESGQRLGIKRARDSGDDEDTEEQKARQPSPKVSTPRKQRVLTKQKPRHDALRWVEPPLSQWASTEELPKLPIIADPFVLFTFWNNGKIVQGASGKPRFEKDLNWAFLERLGDAQLRCLSLQELANIFGKDNYVLITGLIDHARSNQFFASVSKHYRLDTLVKYPPQLQTPYPDTNREDLFKAWIGAHIQERLQYDCHDPLYELTYFLNRLWDIRYTPLKRYRYAPTANSKVIPSGTIRRSKSTPIEFKSDEQMKRTLGLLVNSPNLQSKPVIGYFVQLDMKQDISTKTGTPVSYSSFATSEIEAKNMKKRILWTSPEPAYNAPKTSDGALFGAYRLKCSSLMESFLRAPDSEKDTLLPHMTMDCDQWIEQVQSAELHPDQQKTKALLYWYKAFIELQMGHDDEANELIQKVKNYAQIHLPITTNWLSSINEQNYEILLKQKMKSINYKVIQKEVNYTHIFQANNNRFI